MKLRILISIAISFTIAGCGGPAGLYEKLTAPQNSTDAVSGGDGYSSPIHQNYTQSYQYAAYDILWVLDNSGSMVDEVNYVRDNMTYFAQTMQTRRSIQYQMAVVNTDWRDATWGHGKFRGTTPTISYTHTDPVAEFVNAVNDIHMCANGACSSTNGDEMGLASAKQALVDHSSFMRSNANLIVAIVSDEQDSSCNTSNGTSCTTAAPHTGALIPTSTFVSYFNSVKPSGTGATAYYPVVGIKTTDCSTILSAGTRYLDVLTSFGLGAQGSICASEFGNSVNRIANAIADNGLCFALAYAPNPTTIDVFVDELLVKSGYSLDTTNNSICFDTNHIPQNGQKIAIEYLRK